MDNEQYIESGLSVGAVKYLDATEIFTEEEINAINNKIPELDRRVGITEDEIEEINSSLDNKANKNEVFSMANMGQDVKEAMTGGSVAVVGENSTDIVNLKDRTLNILAEKITSTNINYDIGTTAANGNILDWPNRIISDFVKLNKCVIRLNDKENYKFYVNFYTNDKTYIKQTTFSTNEVISEEPRYVRIVVAKKTDKDINSSEIENIKNNIVIYNYQGGDNLEKIKTLDEKNKMTAKECWYYDKELVIENYSNPTTIYVKFDKLTRRLPNKENIIRWDKVETDINDSSRFVTSPNGVSNCLRIDADEVFYVDKNNKLGVIHKFDYDIYNTLLCFATWGRHYGLLTELYINTHIDELDDTIDELNDTIDELDDTVKTLFKECWYYDKELVIENYSNPTTIYVKFDKLTRRLPNKENIIRWDKVETDINDSSRFVTSPNGVSNCLRIDADEIFYVDKDIKLGVISKYDFDKINTILCFATWGRHYGLLSELYTNAHINNLIDDVAILKGNNELNQYPTYFAEEIDDTVNKINDFMNIGGNDVAVVGFVTDTHWGVNKKNSPSIAKEVMDRCKIPVLINGGDIVTGSGIFSREKTIKDIIEEKKAFSVVNNIYTKGNHDPVYGVNSYYDSYIPAKEFYNYFYREANKNVESSNDGTCFYQDFKQEKIRVISLNVCDLDGKEVLNNHFASEENIEWLDRILNDIPNEYVAVITTHIPLWDNEECPWSSNTSYVKNRADILNVLNKYQGKVSCILSGHEHNDYIVQKGNVPQIITACDAFMESTVSDGMYRPDRESGTHTEQILDFVCINRKTKEIVVIRCGAGGDRTARYI